MAFKPKCTFYNQWRQANDRDFLWNFARSILERHLPNTSPIAKAIDDRDVNALLKYDVDYRLGLPAEYMIYLRQILALFQKNDDLSIGVDRSAVALETFNAAEGLCAQTNRRFQEYRRTPEKWGPENVYIARLSRKISSILGECPSLSELHLHFGPGANVGCNNNTTALFKLAANPTCSKEAQSALASLWDQIPYYAYFHKGACDVVPGKLSFVPKNAKTDRSIMVEPLMNSFVQLGFGTYMKRLLKRAGCNLYTQAKNRSYSRVGSLTGDYATIDLSSASDTLASQVVLDLLPFDWFDALSTWRTGTVKLPDGTLIELEKFSSMGNGFTFELETVIFYAVACLACIDAGVPTDIAVYGDDIIVPTAAAPFCLQGLNLLGFIPNKDKTYLDGEFRESCGADWYRGINIRPFYVRSRLTSARLTGLYNFLVREFPGLYHQDILASIVQAIPERDRLFGPAYISSDDGVLVPAGDGHLVDLDFEGTVHKRDQQWGGFTFRTFVKKARRVRFSTPAYDLYPSYSTYTDASRCRESDPYSVRGGEVGKVQRVYTLRTSPMN